jgi:prolyl-tRNA synthetase
VVRRDSRAKESVPVEGAAARIAALLEEVQTGLRARATQFVADNTHTVSTYDDFKRVMAEQRGFIRAFWCGSSACEQRIKEETRATIRVIPEDAEAFGSGPCILCGAEAGDETASKQALFAQSY